MASKAVERWAEGLADSFDSYTPLDDPQGERHEALLQHLAPIERLVASVKEWDKAERAHQQLVQGGFAAADWRLDEAHRSMRAALAAVLGEK